MDKNKKSYLKGAATGVALGALAGAVAGILFAPKSGKETREDIAKTLHEIKDKVADQLEKAGDFTKEKYSDVVESVVANYEKAKKITTKQATEIKKDLTSGFDKVKKSAKN